MLTLPSTSEIAEISVRLRVRSGSLAIKGVSETEAPRCAGACAGTR